MTDTVQLSNGESIEVMDFEEWEEYHEENIECSLYGQWLFITNGDCDLEEWKDGMYQEYVDKIVEHFEKEGA